MNKIPVLSSLMLAMLLAGCNQGSTQNPAAKAAAHTPEAVSTLAQTYQWTRDDANFEPFTGYIMEGGNPIGEPDIYYGKLDRHFEQFDDFLKDYDEASYQDDVSRILGKEIPDLQAMMNAGELSAEQLVRFYLYRIGKYDIDKLNSIIELNPDIVALARQSDKDRAKHGQHGRALLGIPVLLKDNIATDDRLHTATGAAAMLQWDPDRDAFAVNKLRKAGALILGKANQGEWANYTSSSAPNGFSNNGGQTRNPYLLTTTYGSSSGSAVAATANFATVTVGSETDGSIVYPANINSAVGLKTSRGLISRDYVIPLDEAQDVLGPIGRTVRDVAITLTVMAGVDKADARTQDAAALAGTDFLALLDHPDLSKLHVGFGAYLTNDGSILFDEDKELFSLLKKSGLDVKLLPEMNNVNLPDGMGFSTTIQCGFKYSLNHFLAELNNQVPFASIQDIVEWNRTNPDEKIVYGQDHLEASANTTLSEEECKTIHQTREKLARQTIDDYLATQGINVYVSSAARNVTYAPAGYPDLTVPVGYRANGEPKGAHITGTFLSEPQLLTVGYLLEQATKGTDQARKDPDLDAAIERNENAGIVFRRAH